MEKLYCTEDFLCGQSLGAEGMSNIHFERMHIYHSQKFPTVADSAFQLFVVQLT